MFCHLGDGALRALVLVYERGNDGNAHASSSGELRLQQGGLRSGVLG